MKQTLRILAELPEASAFLLLDESEPLAAAPPPAPGAAAFFTHASAFNSCVASHFVHFVPVAVPFAHKQFFLVASQVRVPRHAHVV